MITQFSPLFVFFLFVYVWLVFVLILILVWWGGKKAYSL
nr:ATP synthase F0 subunit 8 [Euglesa coreana]UYR45738.1 ATP synthase F0 subunit 8 [Euglesa coreana]UYR45751.1 ATP synthase F0 subunit 8 [Euglesa coreana]